MIVPHQAGSRYMPKLKRLSGADVVKILGLFGFYIKSQKGSHIKLRREVDDNAQTLTIGHLD
jgi:predicted RNA binding protein YcfA (HicA-like mRNA interferase family)